MPDRTGHQEEVLAFVKKESSLHDWEISVTHGMGKESYIARSHSLAYFIKLDAPLANYQVMASLGLTPPVMVTSVLEDGTSLLVQLYIESRTPTWADFRLNLEKIAEVVWRMHHSSDLRVILPAEPFEQYRGLGLQALTHLRHRWELFRPLVPGVAGWVDENLDQLAMQIETLDGSGAVAVHHDICNANWLISPDGQVYLIDLDSLSMDDPAADLGPLLWWYYPPGLRERFLELAGLRDDAALRHRMRLRMAMHCLSILLPRENSFDHFDGDEFVAQLVDFRAILGGGENPQGYG